MLPKYIITTADLISFMETQEFFSNSWLHLQKSFSIFVGSWQREKLHAEMPATEKIISILGSMGIKNLKSKQRTIQYMTSQEFQWIQSDKNSSASVFTTHIQSFKENRIDLTSKDSGCHSTVSELYVSRIKLS